MSNAEGTAPWISGSRNCMQWTDKDEKRRITCSGSIATTEEYAKNDQECTVAVTPGNVFTFSDFTSDKCMKMTHTGGELYLMCSSLDFGCSASNSHRTSVLIWFVAAILATILTLIL